MRPVVVNAVLRVNLTGTESGGFKLMKRYYQFVRKYVVFAELLGLDALNFANEGKLVIVSAKEKTAEILTALRRHPLGENAAVIGEVTTDGKVRAVGLFGQSRLLDFTTQRTLPRIC